MKNIKKIKVDKEQATKDAAEKTELNKNKEVVLKLAAEAGSRRGPGCVPIT